MARKKRKKRVVGVSPKPPEPLWVPLQEDKRLGIIEDIFIEPIKDKILDKALSAFDIKYKKKGLALQIYIFKNPEEKKGELLAGYIETHSGRILSASKRAPKHKDILRELRNERYNMIFLFELIKPLKIGAKRWRFIVKPTHSPKISKLSKVRRKYMSKYLKESLIVEKIDGKKIGPKIYGNLEKTMMGRVIIEEYLAPTKWVKFMSARGMKTSNKHKRIFAGLYGETLGRLHKEGMYYNENLDTHFYFSIARKESRLIDFGIVFQAIKAGLDHEFLYARNLIREFSENNSQIMNAFFDSYSTKRYGGSGKLGALKWRRLETFEDRRKGEYVYEE